MDDKKNTNYYNVKKWNSIQALKRKNLNLSKEIDTNVYNFKKTSEKYMLNLSKKLVSCGSISLYSEDELTDNINGMAGWFCGDKICFICNYLRAKATRRKYIKFFKENPYLLKIELETKKGLRTKIITHYQREKHYKANKTEAVNYNLMHFSLTVPHTLEHGWRGKQLYFTEFIKAMREMRRSKAFKNVFGGEYGIEVTRNDNGFHIHSHGLLLVKDEKQSRNNLHKELLLTWNKLTIDEHAQRTELTEAAKSQIKKSNKLLTEQDILKLNPKGATLISLENLYLFNESGDKDYINNKSGQKFINGVMEAIKYHFEPLFFDKKDKTFDIDLISELKPLLHGKPLYQRFGCLINESYLNIGHLRQEFSEAVEAKEAEDNKEQTKRYFITNTAYMFGDMQNKRLYLSNTALNKRIILPVQNSYEALEMLSKNIKYSKRGLK